jgi:hypothetical protein
LQSPESCVERIKLLAARTPFAGNGAEYGLLFFPRQCYPEASLARRKGCRPRRKLQASAADHAIQALVRQDRGVSLDLIGQTFALPRALCAAHFKDIGEVGIELKEQ